MPVMRKLLALLSLLAMTALPIAAAQDYGGDQASGDVEINNPDVDVDADVDDDDADESTFAGLSTTVVIILIVLAVLVVALIVAMASRP